MSSTSVVTNVTQALGSFAMFVVSAKLEEHLHAEGSDSANVFKAEFVQHVNAECLGQVHVITTSVL